MTRCAGIALCWILLSLTPTGSFAGGTATANEAASPLIGDDGGLGSDVFDAVGSTALHLGTDFYEQLSYPFVLAGRDRSRFLLGSAGIVALILTDRFTYQPMAHPPFLPDESLVGPARTLSNLGNTRNAIPLVLGFGAAGLITGSHREKQTSIMLAEALVTSGVWTSLLKYASGRERPREMQEAVADWTGPGGAFADDDTRGGHASFPSGHATGIWAAATVLAHQYPQGRVVPIAAYGTAAAISYSRMVVGAHFLSDVVVGGLIGYGCARQVIGAHERSEGPSRFHLLYEPSGDEQRVGLAMDF
ncbi:MAG TPA: phosphatase PAP2 family protein [Candidatus Krumholzibacteria bacterium]|nr:phosphatase PAP2 family protein [Candidatus Krumholzibacteria bacterium]